MKRLLVCMGVAAGAAAPAFAAGHFDLQGRVPFSITAGFLESRYERLGKAIAPDTAIDTGAITIIYYSKKDEKKLGVRLPEWGGGGAIGRDTVIVPIDRFPLEEMDIGQVTVHELVHIALERAYGRLRLPRWFHEGLAMTLSGELSFEEQVAVSRAILAKRLMPLDSVERVNRFDRFGAVLAYSQSHLAAAYLIEKFGMDGVSDLLDGVRETGRFDSALAQRFGLTGPEFEGMVRNYIVERYRFMFFLGDSWFFWTLGAFLVVAGFIAVKLRNRKREKQMEEEERREKEKADTAATAPVAAKKERLKRITLDEVLDDFGDDRD